MTVEDGNAEIVVTHDHGHEGNQNARGRRYQNAHPANHDKWLENWPMV